MTYRQVLDKAWKMLEKAHCDVNVARFLIVNFSSQDLEHIILNEDKEINFKSEDYFKSLQKYIDGKPLQYILKYEYFYGRKHLVKKGVFIPRPETEQLITLTLDEIKKTKQEELTVVDICTGSGAIINTLFLETKRKNVDFYAIEKSPTAIAMAKKNSKLLKTKVNFIKGDFIKPLIKKGIKADIIVTNPPYVALTDKVADRVLNWEPKMALYGGESGLKYFRILFQNLHKICNKNAIILIEHGEDQRYEIEKLLREHLPNQKFKYHYDFNIKWRNLVINYENN